MNTDKGNSENQLKHRPNVTSASTVFKYNIIYIYIGFEVQYNTINQNVTLFHKWIFTCI